MIEIGILPTDEQQAIMAGLKRNLDRYRARQADGASPARWLMAPRIARAAIACLRCMLEGDDGREIPPDELTQLWGVPVEIVTDLPQGAVFR